jgi:hypothetical protein
VRVGAALFAVGPSIEKRYLDVRLLAASLHPRLDAFGRLASETSGASGLLGPTQSIQMSAGNRFGGIERESHQFSRHTPAWCQSPQGFGFS